MRLFGQDTPDLPCSTGVQKLMENVELPDARDWREGPEIDASLTRKSVYFVLQCVAHIRALTICSTAAGACEGNVAQRGSREGAGARRAALGGRRRLRVGLLRHDVQQVRKHHQWQARRVPQALHRRIYEARVACAAMTTASAPCSAFLRQACKVPRRGWTMSEPLLHPSGEPV